MDNRPIGVFDSGVGGMTVLKEIMKKLPQENFVYLGDTKCFPYGSKSKETIIDLTKEGIEFLIKKNVKLIVIACGTATTQSLETVEKLYDIPIIGVVKPTIEHIIKTGKTNIGIIATAGTIRSGGWKRSILKDIPNARTQSIACPLLASMVEEGWYNNQIAKLVVKEYLKPLKKVDTLILGCTHYPLLTNVLRKQIGSKTEIINTGTYVAENVKNILEEKDMLSKTKNVNLDIYLTETEHKFNEVATALLGKKVKAKLVEEKTKLNV